MADNNPRAINEALNVDPLIHVFRYLKTDELIKCKEVCPMWEGLIDKYVGLKVYVGNCNPRIWEIVEENPIEWKEMTVFQEQSIRECYMSFNSLENDPANNAGERLQILNPNILKKLWIDGAPPLRHLEHIVGQCKHITDLSLHFFTTAFDLTIDLPQLKRFTISTIGNYELTNTQRTERHVSQLINFFRRNGVMSKVLREIGLQVPLEAHQEVIIAEILQLIIRHQNSLDVIKLQLERGDLIDPPNEQIERFRAEAQNIKPAPTEFKMNRLKELCLHSKAYARNHRSILPVLEFFAPTKPTLETLHLSLGYRRFPETMILNNSTTLQVVELSVNTQNHNEPVNLTPLEHCHNLRVLKLMGQSIGEEDPDFEQAEPDLTNLNSIPIGIQNLSFINLRIRKDDGNLLLRLENLRRVILSNTASAHYGLLVNDAVTLINKTELDEIELDHAVNMESINNQGGAAGDNLLITDNVSIREKLIKDGIWYFIRKKENLVPEHSYAPVPDYLEFKIKNGIFGDGDEEAEEENEQDDEADMENEQEEDEDDFDLENEEVDEEEDFEAEDEERDFEEEDEEQDFQEDDEERDFEEEDEEDDFEDEEAGEEKDEE